MQVFLRFFPTVLTFEDHIFLLKSQGGLIEGLPNYGEGGGGGAKAPFSSPANEAPRIGLLCN